jgi:hypothetical protein
LEPQALSCAAGGCGNLDRASGQPYEALSENLLGLSFRSRLRFEFSNGRMVLEQ